MKVKNIYGFVKHYHVNYLIFTKYYNSILSKTILNNFKITSFA